MPERSSTGRLDLNQLAKSIVGQATGDVLPEEDTGKNPAAVALGRLGGEQREWLRNPCITPTLDCFASLAMMVLVESIDLPAQSLRGSKRRSNPEKGCAEFP